MAAGRHRSTNTPKNLGKIIIVVIILLILLDYLYEHSSLLFRKWYYPTFSTSYRRQEVTLKKGEHYHIKGMGVSIVPFKYRSTDFKVAGVNMLGKVTAHRPGQAIIRIRTDQGERKIRVNVLEQNKENLNLSVGSSYRLKIRGPSGNVKFKSSDSKVATVSSWGKVKAKNPGTVVITMQAKGLVFQCTVHVEK